MSTTSLVAAADFVVGVDVSEDMLRHAQRAPTASFVLAVAEHLPFGSAVFDLATMASAIHWFEPSALREVRRVLNDSGGLLVYDVWFRGEMAGEPEFGRWLETVSDVRYPVVEKHPRPDLRTVGFQLAWEDDIRRDLSMTVDELVDYLMTHSERIAAVRRGEETAEGQRLFLRDGLAPFFEGAPTRELGFGIGVEMFTVA